MTQNKPTYVTKDGLQKLEDELKELKVGKRKEISERIQDAKELGDLSENAEYQEAKEEQGFVEARITELESTLKNVEIIEHKKNTSEVQIGSHVSVTGSAGNDMMFEIVGSSEADPSANRISNESPIGQALIGSKIGETVTFNTPSGEMQYTVKAVE